MDVRFLKEVQLDAERMKEGPIITQVEIKVQQGEWAYFAFCWEKGKRNIGAGWELPLSSHSNGLFTSSSLSRNYVGSSLG